MLHILQHIHVKTLRHGNPPDFLNQGFIPHVRSRKNPKPRVVETPLSRAKAILGGNGRASPRNQGIALRLIIRHDEIWPKNEPIKEFKEAGPHGQAARVVLGVSDCGAELGVADDVVDSTFVRVVVHGQVVGGFYGVFGEDTREGEQREWGGGGATGREEMM